MEAPTVRSSLVDPKSGIAYHVVAYRQITRAELIQAVRAYHAQPKRKKLKAGQEVTIITIIGHDG